MNLSNSARSSVSLAALAALAALAGLLVACSTSGSSPDGDGEADSDEFSAGGSAAGGAGGADSSPGGGAADSGDDTIGTGGETLSSGGSGAMGSGGQEGPPEVSLVTSAKGDYFQLGEVAPVAAGPATLTVDSTTKTVAGTWYGFGGAFNEKGWWALQHLSPEDRDAVMRLLFDDHDGIGFDWARIPIGPNEYSVERYSLSDAPGHFDVSHEEQYLIPFIQAAQAIKGDVKYWASPWSPPPWAKVDDGMTENDGHDKGLFDTAHFQDYADYITAWVDAYEQRGIPIDHVQPQSEPGFIRSTPSCAFGPAQDVNLAYDVYQSESASLGPFVVDYLKPALDATPYGTKIWYGPLSNEWTFDAYWESLTDRKAIWGVALMWGSRTRVAAVRETGLPVMQAEHMGGNFPWLPEAASVEDADRQSFLADMAPNNHAYGEESWDLIKAWIDEGVNVYNSWNMVLDTEGFNLDVVRPWPQNAMIAVDTEARTFQITPYYYVFRHVAQYVDVGASVLVVEGDALAFQNPDGTFVVIVFNEEEEEVTHILDVEGTLLEFVVPSRGWVTVNWEG